jgi:hypothetical protein
MQICEEKKKKKLFLVGWWVGVGVGLAGSQRRGVGEREGGWWASPESQICRRGVGRLRCKGWSSPICCSAWASPPVVGCVFGFRAGAMGGLHRCIRWWQWLKVAEAEGVGPVGGGGRKKREEEKILGGKKKALYAFKF